MEDDIEDELVKEVYAQFGLAYYFSECLHRELCHLYAINRFQLKTDIIRPAYEENLKRAYKSMLGGIIEELRETIPTVLYEKLVEANKQRIFIAHYFWFERIHLFRTKQGIMKLLNELAESQKCFHNLDIELQEFGAPIKQRIGLTEELIQEALDEIEYAEPLPDQRFLNKMEIIKKVWDTPDKNLVFETNDGSLWQLCDIGLCWFTNSKVTEDWKENLLFARYLPASINPRPKIIEPWKYEIDFGNKAILSIQKSSKERTHIWSLKEKRRNK